jgi:hypothetical protein
MKYVFGVIKRASYSKSKKITRSRRKHYFCYEFDVESGKFKRVRISTIKAIYYKITFIFGLKAKKVTNVYCKDCKKHYDCIVNFWDKDLDCPNC